MTKADIAVRLDDLRARQEWLLTEVREQIEALAPPESTPPGTAIAQVGEDGLLSNLILDPQARRRVKPEDLASAIDRAVQAAQQPAVSARRAVGVGVESGPPALNVEGVLRAANRMTAALETVNLEGPPRSPHVTAGTGVKATASYGVVRSVICDPGWLVRSTDLDISEGVVAVCRQAAAASDEDFGGKPA